ncbi:MAG TPA: hypothetical protein VIB79_01395 [Candidatus Binatia bacterium]|jgi:hypothetical protein
MALVIAVPGAGCAGFLESAAREVEALTAAESVTASFGGAFIAPSKLVISAGSDEIIRTSELD